LKLRLTSKAGCGQSSKISNVIALTRQQIENYLLTYGHKNQTEKRQ
jgi:hypothetical protein